MKIVKDYPPNYDQIIEAIPDVADSKNVVFTYGDTIYAPYKKGKLPKHLKEHEKEHTRQQGDDPHGWWVEYLVNIEFRLAQEVEAYRKQYRFFKSRNHDLQKQANLLDQMALSLSGPLYGNIISIDQAKELIIMEYES